jgi:hypothetical protein
LSTAAQKLIEGSSMFRRSFEGRFAFDVVRTILQWRSAGARVPRVGLPARMGGECQRACDRPATEMLDRRAFADMRNGRCRRALALDG